MMKFIDYYGEIKHRKCWNCKIDLRFDHFYKVNWQEFSSNTIRNLWMSKTVEILCCTCYKEFTFRKNFKKIKNRLKSCSVCGTPLDLFEFDNIYSTFPIKFVFKLWQNSCVYFYCDKCLNQRHTNNEVKKKGGELIKKRKFIEKNREYVIRNKYETERVLKEIDPREKEFLELLEKQIEISIPFIKKVSSNYFGFNEKNGHVINLYLSACNLNYVPEEIKWLISLKKLDLSNNNLQKLPHTIGYLNSLEHLRINKNMLTVLPRSFSRLSSLKELNLESNCFIEVPTCISSLKSLKYLDLSNNYLSYLPEFLGDLPFLRYLYIQGNKIMYLPDSLEEMRMGRFMLIQ